MFKSFKSYIQTRFDPAHLHEQSSAHDLQLATATLMFELIKADSQIDDNELVTLAKLLEQEFDLNRQEIDELMQLSQEAADAAICLQPFTKQICDKLDNAQRVNLLTNFWKIALADGRIDTHERHLIRKIAGLLYLNDRQINQAREKAKALN